MELPAATKPTNANFVRVIIKNVQWIKVVPNDSIGTCSSKLYSFNLLKIPPPPRAAILVLYIHIYVHQSYIMSHNTTHHPTSSWFESLRIQRPPPSILKPNPSCTQAVYRQKAREAEWRQDIFGPVTRKGSGNWNSVIKTELGFTLCTGSAKQPEWIDGYA